MVEQNVINETLMQSYDEIQMLCRPQSGDCGSVARAIQNVFGGTLVALYNDPETDRLPKHVLVEIDGTLYDNEGATDTTEIYTQFMPPSPITPTKNEINSHYKHKKETIHDSMFVDYIIKQVTVILERTKKNITKPTETH